MSSSIPASAYVEHFDPELPHHRAWLQAVLEQLVSQLRIEMLDVVASANGAVHRNTPRRPGVRTV